MIEEKISIKNMIYEIRGRQVILDSDLAKLYQVETKRINEAVKNNLEKFPSRYTFRITDKEYNSLKSKISTSKGGSRKGHTAFIEQGVYMLATILKSSVATEVSIGIMDAFVEMRAYINSSLNIQKYINEIVLEDHEEIKILKEVFDSFKEKSNHIFFKGQIYDAYSLMIDIFNKSKKSIIIIDNYIDKNLLDILRDTNKRIIIITNKYNNKDYLKYIRQYNNIKLIINNSFHDRFIIIDKRYLYHCGASFKDLGKKCFAVNKISVKSFQNDLLTKVYEVTNECND